MAVRAALGASRLQIARQLLAESVLISAAAGVVGLLLASWDNDRTKSQLPALVLRLVPGIRNMRIDSTAVLFTLALSLAAGILCSLPAILHLVYGRSRTNPADALRERGSGGPGAAGSRMRAALIVSELAMALVLLTGAGFMVQIFNHLLERDQGFDPRNALTMQVSLSAAGYGRPAGVISFYDRALEGLASVPGVTAAGLSSSLGPAERLGIEGRPEARPGDTRPEVIAIGGGYLDAMRIPLLAGRPISGRDRRESPRVVVVSDSVARYYWPGASPIGRHIRIGGQADWLTVVGVCGDIKNWFTGEAQAAAYIPYAQSPPASATFILRTAGQPLQAAAAARSAIAGIDHDLPVYEVTTLEQTISDEQSGVRGAASAMTTYALISLLLAVTGVYAVISYFVAARTHDIGIRVALGASRAEVLGTIARQTARLTAAALACGIPLAILLTRVMARALYADIYAGAGRFALLTAVLVAAALAATYFPARRAMNIDPMNALRDE
jgi:putative ABC transport system permease protein